MNLSAGFAVMRKRHGIKTIDMAKASGKSVRSIQNMMAPTANPTFKTIVFCCELIGCSLEELAIETQKCK